MKKQDQAEEILRMLDDMQRVNGDPWLYERVQGRLQALKNVQERPDTARAGMWKRKADLLLWPAFCLILLLNAWLLWRPQSPHNSHELQQALQDYYLDTRSENGIYSY